MTKEEQIARFIWFCFSAWLFVFVLRRFLIPSVKDAIRETRKERERMRRLELIDRLDKIADDSISFVKRQPGERFK